jgi:TolA-binding protein
MKRTERHHLKENELVSTVARARETFETYRKPITAGLVVAGVIVLVVIGLLTWRSRTENEARALLADALVAEQAQVAPAPAPGATAPAPAPAGSFPTAKARDEAALAKFMAVANAYPDSTAGIAARYHAASLLAGLGRAPEAIQRYQEVADRAGKSVYAEMARLGVAAESAASGQYDKAISTFKELSARADGRLPVDGILMQLARTYSGAGRMADAKQTFKRVVDEFPQSPFAAEAKRAMDQIKG